LDIRHKSAPDREQIGRQWGLKDMRKYAAYRHLSIVLLPFVVLASVASIDALVLCTRGCEKDAADAVHAAHAVLGTPHTHCCSHGEEPTDEIGHGHSHDHESCRDIPLSLNQGKMPEQDGFLVVLGDGPQTGFNARGESSQIPDPDTIDSISLSNLRTVVLLI
jgi:hypothetical protein